MSDIRNFFGGSKKGISSSTPASNTKPTTVKPVSKSRGLVIRDDDEEILENKESIENKKLIESTLPVLNSENKDKDKEGVTNEKITNSKDIASKKEGNFYYK